MSLPSILQKKIDLELRNKSDTVLLALVFSGCETSPDLLNQLLEKKVAFKTIYKSIFQGFARQRYCPKSSGQCKLMKVETNLYEGFSVKLGVNTPHYRTIKVSAFLIKKLKIINEQKFKEDIKEDQIRQKLVSYQNRVFSSRCFPPKLRTLILERDNFTCQHCGITSQQAIKLNRMLEIHHIKAWEDGGETTYKNGITLCSKCNVGTHYTKPYQRLK
ncbi:HNH endonuclease [Photobacterium leiognathi]|uniref:HNH endonuclease n=1 Tax=Photobacterium leiognathi TaxID=553611 RepID=UPI002980D2CB|nr:HNH endonuclease [Photobacterium leiognathi]